MTAATRELTCREVNDFLAAYLANELTARERTLFDDHLAVCPDCRAYLRQYEVTRELCKGALEAEATDAGVPEELVRAILAARPAEPTEAGKEPSPRGPRRRG
jgi:predicted anti-sigma-YlaC factor YlaD